MSTLINFSLFTLGIVGVCIGLSNAMGEKSNKLTRYYFFAQGIFLCLWCCGYALMGSTQNEAHALIFRNVGLFGVLSFMTAETYFLIFSTGILYRYKNIVLSVVTLAAVLDFILFSGSSNVEFIWNDGRMCYYATGTIVRTFHNAVITGYFLLLLMIALRWERGAVLEREKKVINAMIYSNISIVIFTLPDTFLPLLGIPSIPTTGYGAFITFTMTYYAAVKKNMFRFSQHNLGEYIYQYVNSPVLVFDHNNQLIMKNDFAAHFFNMEENEKQRLSDIFEVSEEDAEAIFAELYPTVGKSCKLVSLQDGKMCALTFTMIADDYQKPYCTIAIVYDLTRETKILEELKDVKAQLECQLEKKSRQVERMNLQTIMTIANTIDARDEYTKGHSVRVAEYCGIFAKKLGWTEEEIQNLKYVALLHDIGKIGVPDAVLNKPGKLSDVEYRLIQKHTLIGDEIVKDISMIPNLKEGVRSHHERWDGKGYPDELKEDEIPVVAQIICIADCYDAMNSSRIYRNHLDEQLIENQLEEGRNKQFSPKLLDMFLELLRDGQLKIENSKVEMEESFEEESNKLFDRVMNNYGNEEQDRDFLTCLWSRKSGERMIISEMQRSGGCLAFVDLDNLKYVNDIYGHLAGDYTLKLVGTVLDEQGAGMIAVRLGGDEFLVFMPGADKEEATENIEAICMTFQRRKEKEEFMKQTSISAGLYICNQNTIYADALQRADKALYHVKQNGKRGYYFYSEKDQKSSNESTIDLRNLMKSIQKQGNYYGAYNVNYREFANIYQLISSMAKRYDYRMELLLVTISPRPEEFFTMEQEETALFCMEKAIGETLRTVDVSTRFSSSQMLVILTHVDDKYVKKIVERIFERFLKIYAKDDACLSYDLAQYQSDIGKIK